MPGAQASVHKDMQTKEGVIAYAVIPFLLIV